VTPSRTVCLDPRELVPDLDTVTVIDVRTPGEHEAVRIPRSRNLPLDALDQHLDEVRDRVRDGERVVLLCRSGARAHQAQERLVEAGLPALPIVEGGIVAWQQAEGPVVQDVLRWDLERQVRLVAGAIVLLAVLASIAWPPARFVAGAVGAGLVFAAVTNTCGLALLLSRLPYNRPGRAPA
jgi:rhodanese-related sulfurtransferase